MRRACALASFILAALCWIAAGPGGVTLQAMLACRHHAMHQTGAGHHHAPAKGSGGPCFCDEMTGGGGDLVVSEAFPTVPAVLPAVATPVRTTAYVSRFPLPPSPAFPPLSPPPIALA
jgi:hypothetical protein